MFRIEGYNQIIIEKPVLVNHSLNILDKYRQQLPQTSKHMTVSNYD